MTAFLLTLTVLATKSKVTLPKADDPLVLAAVAVTAIWLLLLLAFAVSTRPRGVEAAAPTMDLGPEPPAIVNLLVNHCRVTTYGLQATLLDLAARKFIEIEEYGAGEQILCRIREPAPDTPLESYTKIVYDHVRADAVNGSVVAQALTTGTRGKAAAWWSGFQRLVLQDARARGLTQDRWSRPMWGIQRLAGLAAAALVLVVAARANAVEPALAVIILVAASTHTVLAKLFGEQQLSEEGRKAASHWLGVRRYLADSGGLKDDSPGAVELWDRYLAYAAAMGLATKAIHALPMGAEDDHRAWSAYGGDWRQVRVDYPRYRIIWGRSPLGALFTALIIGALGCGVICLSLQVRDFTHGYSSNDETVHWIRTGTLIAIAAGVLVFAWGVRTLSLAFLDVWTRIDLQGEIVRRRSFTDDKNVLYFLALDDGKAARVRAWRVQAAMYQKYDEGSIVKAQISPRLGYVFRMEGVAQASAAAQPPVLANQPPQ